jgi:ketosteroid isomerase-like protein
MSTAFETVQMAYGLARRADHRNLRGMIADDATWEPAKEGAWNPCRDADTIVRTLLWRAGAANRMRPGEVIIDLGNQVVLQLKGRRLDRLGAKGFIPRLYQVVEVRNGKIVRMHDYPRREDAMAGAGHTA